VRRIDMVRRPGDKTPEPPGGRAAERLRMFEEARGGKEVPRSKKEEPTRSRKATPMKKGAVNAKQNRRNA
jgi:hypothetical protein